MGVVIPFPKRPAQDPLIPKHLMAAHLGYSVRWLELRVAEGLPSYREGARLMFRASEVEDWLMARAKAKEAASGG